MKKLYRDLTQEAKASYGITEDRSDESWVYCTTCDRAMKQGDCIVGEQGVLQCAYDDCMPEGNVAFQSLYGWDAYQQELGGEAAHWPEKPEWGKRYERRGASS
jgi:hypothetical protein